jgi:hypothetical protein
MSDNLKHIDVDSEEFEDAPKALREYVKKLQAQSNTLAQERDDARGQVASRAVADVLADKGFKNPERVKRDLLADNIDPLDSSAVDGWLTRNGDDYAKSAQQAEKVAGQQSATVVQEVVDGYQNLQVSGEPASNDKLAMVLSKITPEMDGKAVEALYREHGI